MSPIEKLTGKIKDSGEIRLNQNIISYLVCVLIASCLWLLNALNQDNYAATLTYPVRYTGLPENMYPTVPLPSEIRLEVKAKGFALLKYKIQTSFQPIILNVASYNDKMLTDGERYRYTLNAAGLKEKVGSQLATDIRLTHLHPENIVFEFSKADRRKIAILPVVDYSLKKQYILNRITCSPDSVWVNGPRTLLDTLSHVLTEPLSLKGIDGNRTRTTRLAGLPSCVIKDREVEIRLEAEKYTEAGKTVSITPLNVPDSMQIRLFPPHVDIRYEVGLSNYGRISEKDFLFTVEYPRDTEDNYLKVKVARQPSCIKNLSLSPRKVEYILEKK